MLPSSFNSKISRISSDSGISKSNKLSVTLKVIDYDVIFDTSLCTSSSSQSNENVFGFTEAGVLGAVFNGEEAAEGNIHRLL